MADYGIAAALFGANVLTAVDQDDLFTHGQATTPLAHYWSLAV